MIQLPVRLSVRLSETERGERVFLGSYKRQTTEIFSEYSYDICSSNLYIVLSICQLIGVLDQPRFLHFVIFSSPFQDE